MADVSRSDESTYNCVLRQAPHAKGPAPDRSQPGPRKASLYLNRSVLCVLLDLTGVGITIDGIGECGNHTGTPSAANPLGGVLATGGLLLIDIAKRR